MVQPVPQVVRRPLRLLRIAAKVFGLRIRPACTATRPAPSGRRRSWLPWARIRTHPGGAGRRAPGRP